MINTIFYFPQSQEEFETAGGINEKTICFIPNDNATGQIVMGGRNYSGTVDVNSLTQTIQNIIQTAMPPATKDTIGGVKIGNGLNITTDGTTSVNDTYINDLIAAYTGGAGTGGGNFSGWSWAGLYDDAEGKRSIGTLTINGTSKTIYIPKDVVGEGGGTADPYDDTELRNQLEGISDRLTSEVGTLNNTINGIQSELDDILDETDEEVRTKIGNAFDTYQDFIDMFESDPTINKYIFSTDDVDKWASGRGLVIKNDDNTYKVGWSELIQTVNGIDGRVTLVEGKIGSGGGDVDYELLQAGLYAYIEDQIAHSGLDSTWGRFVTEDELDEWLNSKVETEAGEGYTFARIVSAAKNYDTNSDAIASLKTRVDTIEGDYVSSTNLASQVDQSISGIFTQNSSNSAVAGLFSKVSGIETSTGSNASAISGLQSRVYNLENGDYLTQSSLVSAFVDNKDEIISQAGLVNTAGLDTAKSEISSELQSGLQSAVYTEVSDQLGTATAGFATKSELDDCVKTASVIASINNSGESNVTIDADKVNINGIIDRLNVGTLVADILKDREGHEIALEYLIQKLSTPSYYTVTYRTTSPLVTVSSGASSPALVAAGGTYTVSSGAFSVPTGYSLKNKITIKMGGVDVTNEATPVSYFMYNTGSMQIKNVTGDIEVIAGEPEDITYVKITAPRYVIHEGEEMILTQENNIRAHSFSESWSVSDSSIASIAPQSTGSASVSGDYYDQCKITGGSASSTPVTVTVRTNQSGWNASIDILVIPADAPYPYSFDAGDYYVPVGFNPTSADDRIKINPTITWKKWQNGSTVDITQYEIPEVSYSYEVPSKYQDIVGVDENGGIMPYAQGTAYVNVTLEYEYGSVTDKAMITVTDSMLASNPDVVHADLFGNAEGYSQMVCRTSEFADGETVSQIIYLNSTKYHLDTETYGWIGNVDSSKQGQDKFAVYISSGIYGDSINGFTISSSNRSSDRFVSNPRILSDSTGSLYLVFGVNKHAAAVEYYSGSNTKYVVSAKTVEAITKEYQNTEGIACQYSPNSGDDSEINKRVRTEIITVTAPDGSEIKVTVQQDTKYGIYQQLISGDNISAYYIYPTYAFSIINWGADKEIVESNFAQMCIKAVYGISNTDWGCTSESKISGMNSTAMGNPGIVEDAPYTIEQGVFYEIPKKS